MYINSISTLYIDTVYPHCISTPYIIHIIIHYIQFRFRYMYIHISIDHIIPRFLGGAFMRFPSKSIQVARKPQYRLQLLHCVPTAHAVDGREATKLKHGVNMEHINEHILKHGIPTYIPTPNISKYSTGNIWKLS